LRSNNSSFFILHSSLNFAKQNSVGRAASPALRARVGLSAPSPSRLSSFALSRFGGSATIPLARAPLVRGGVPPQLKNEEYFSDWSYYLLMRITGSDLYFICAFFIVFVAENRVLL
jgi:hypothetical protein